MSRLRPFLRFLGAGLNLVSLVLLGLAGWVGYSQYGIMKTWPAVDAEVARSDVVPIIVRSGRFHGQTVYGALVNFRYAVNGRSYVAPAESGYRTGSQTEMVKWSRQFPVGMRRLIRHHPSDPHRISLVAGYDAVSFAPTLSVLKWALITGGVGILLLSAVRRLA